MSQIENDEKRRYLTILGAWALSFGCSVGWGSFVMPGSTFLPIGGPIGTALGIVIGAAVMFIIGVNYHYLMNRFADGGGAYTYTKKTFGYDHAFLSAWFLIITYIAIIWANATALPLIGRTLFGSTFQFGFDYEIAGFHVYMGEILVAVSSLIIAAFFCLNKKVSQLVQILMAVLLLGGVVICFSAALSSGNTVSYVPPYSPDYSGFNGTFTIFALAPWAYVGFESISHSTGETLFPLKRSFAIMAVGLVSSAIAYSFLALLAASYLPEGCSSWVEYIFNLSEYSGIAAQPAFYGAYRALGNTGLLLLGLAALGGIFTGLIGNYVALSRLLVELSKDEMLPEWFGRINDNDVPVNAILAIMGVSAVLPFFGRTAISWIVDVTTVGATIAYTLCSASAYTQARRESNRKMVAYGFTGLIISLLFALEFLIPNIVSVKTLSTESYLILAVWGILGFLYFRSILRKDRYRRFGRSIIAWVVLLALIIFTSGVWMSQSIEASMNKAVDSVHAYYGEDVDESMNYLDEQMIGVTRSVNISIIVFVVSIVISLATLFDIYAQVQKRERQIEIEKAIAEDSSRAKTSFLSNMSHEIRTPMNAIIGLDNIALRDPDLPPKTREQFEKIGASANHLLGLINDVLDMSRIESGRMVLKNEEFSFREFLDQINIIINGQCIDKGLSYECNINSKVSDYYYGDDMKLKQVLINILGNSVKFTEAPGEVSFNVEQLAADDEEVTLRFIMKDTGIGMDKEYIPKIFEAFSQEDATATNRYGGSGLGMAITKNFVEMMGGSIEVDSEKGVGSTFTVTVKLKPSQRKAIEVQQLTLPEDLRVIVVDDDEIALDNTVSILESLNIGCDAFKSSKDALEKLKKYHEEGKSYDLIITDYRMPEIDGAELVRKAEEYLKNTGVIMLTGYNWDNIENEEGIDAFVAKPLFADVLARQITTVLLEKEGRELVMDSVIEKEKVNLAGKRILMAEDVEQNAEILADLLDLEDIRSEHAHNGEEAVKMFSEHEPGYYDAILMDVRMPVMDGLSATKAIRALDREDAKQIVIIAMTANVFDEDVQNSLKAGMNAHLFKPVEPDKLYETLAEYCR